MREVNNIGKQQPTKFNRFYCDHCEKNLPPNMLNNPKYDDVNTLEELINNWDMLEIPDALFDVVGYIIYLDEKVHAGKLKFCCSW